MSDDDAIHRLALLKSEILATGKRYRFFCLSDESTKPANCQELKAAIKRLALNYKRVYESLALINKHSDKGE